MTAECQILQVWLPLMALTLRWHCAGFSCLFPWPWWRHRQRYDPRDKKPENTEYFTDTIVTMGVAKIAVDADILVNNAGTSISRAPRDALFCKPLYKFSDSLPLILSIWMISNCYRYDVLMLLIRCMLRMWVNVTRQMWRHLNMVKFVEIDLSGRREASNWH